MNPVAAVVLAAGLSSRMGANKLLLPLQGRPIIRHTVATALNSRASPVIVVIGNASADIAAALDGMPVQIRENSLYANGLSESLKCGVRSVPPDCAGALIMLGDMPFVTVETIDCLINAFEADTESRIAIPLYQGQRGNPVLWGRRFFAEIQELSGDKGAKSLMSLHANAVHEVEVRDNGVLIDIDDPSDLQQHQS